MTKGGFHHPDQNDDYVFDLYSHLYVYELHALEPNENGKQKNMHRAGGQIYLCWGELLFSQKLLYMPNVL